jgi:hypothetical protein
MSELVPSSSGLPEEKTGADAVEPTTEGSAPEAPSTEVAPQGTSYAVTPKQGKLTSERVIINAPMSFAGAAQRSFRLRGDTTGIVRVLVTLGVLLLIAGWWGAVLVWYFVFGLLLVPYRLLRRGARKRKAEALRHRELLAALEEKKS